MQLNQLRYFMHVAELGSFSRAATHLRIAQPALSRQIRLLEEELGVVLLHRDGRGATVTKAGAEMLERSVRVFAELAQMKEAIGASAGEVNGTVTIATPPSVGAALMPDVILRVRRAHPELKVRVMESSSTTVLEEWLVSARVDYAVLNAALRVSKSLRSRRLFCEPLYLVGSVDTMRRRETIAFAELRDKELILTNPQHGLRFLLTQAGQRLGVELSPAIEVDSFQILKELAARGAGYAVLPLSAIRRELQDGTLVATRIEGEGLTREMLLAHAIERPPTAEGRAFEAILDEEAARLDMTTTRG